MMFKTEQKLFESGIITESEKSFIENRLKEKPLSLYWELKTILYLGVLMLVSGVSYFVYLNLDSIGHLAIILFLALICSAGFYYGFKNKKPYVNSQVIHESPFFDYAVLFSSLLFGVIVSYLQYQYELFGTHYGLVTVLPTVVYFFAAYSFDHKGILSLGITGLAAWAGISVTPLHMLEESDFSSLQLVFTAIGVGLSLAVFAFLSDKRNIKSHFSFTYHYFASNLLFVATLVLLFSYGFKLFSAMGIALLCWFYIRYAIKNQSFLFLLFTVIYAYVALTYLFFNYLLFGGNDLSLVLGMLYIAASCAGVVLFFVFYKRILKLKT
jgi:hypothetical protein